MNLPESKILIHQFLQTMRMRNCSERTIKSWTFVLKRFIAWCDERGIESMSEITPELLAAYRRSLFHYRNPRNGKSLRFASQTHYLTPIVRWFVWMKAQAFIEHDPGVNFELPKPEERLPAVILTADQVESLLNLPNVSTRLGIRDRAIMETFYSSGIRCSELIDLDVYDIRADRGMLAIRLGKNRKDRMVPIGERALSWVEKWTTDVRPELVTQSSAQALFVSKNGHRLGPTYLSFVVRGYMKKIGIKQRGACHLLRHTAATLMMENGADLRSLQMFLGHTRLNTTQLYTHVSITRLKEVHQRTHPAKPNGLASLSGNDLAKDSGDGENEPRDDQSGE